LRGFRAKDRARAPAAAGHVPAGAAAEIEEERRPLTRRRRRL